MPSVQSFETSLLRADIKCSRIGFGGSRLHYLRSERERNSLLTTAMELGINYFDLAPKYGFGLAERAIGNFVSSGTVRRDELVIATKWGLPAARLMDTLPSNLLGIGAVLLAAANRVFGPSTRRMFTPHLLEQSVNSSLRRLRIEQIDILWMHEPSIHLIPEKDALLSTFDSLRSKGKVRYFGVAGYSEFSQPVFNFLNDDRILYQCEESGWGTGTPTPDVTFGALSPGPQSINSPALEAEAAMKRLRNALVRRERGIILASTTKTKNLLALAKIGKTLE